jgi:hypothetical protein
MLAINTASSRIAGLQKAALRDVGLSILEFLLDAVNRLQRRRLKAVRNPVSGNCSIHETEMKFGN